MYMHMDVYECRALTHLAAANAFLPRIFVDHFKPLTLICNV